MELTFQIIAAIGSLATAGAFFMLFKKDKDKQNQIEKLTKIAAVLENQAESLNLQNDLLAQQIDIFRNTSILTKQNDEEVQKLRALEERKLNLSVKPNLWLNGGSQDGFNGKLKLFLNNKGETAIIESYELESNDIKLENNHLPFEIEKGGERFIYATSLGNKHIKDAQYKLILTYKDRLENEFKAEINGKGASAEIKQLG